MPGVDDRSNHLRAEKAKSLGRDGTFRDNGEAD